MDAYLQNHSLYHGSDKVNSVANVQKKENGRIYLVLTQGKSGCMGIRFHPYVNRHIIPVPQTAISSTPAPLVTGPRE